MPKAGTVTLVIGKATVERGTPTEVQPVHFRDPVYLKDSIATEEESYVRVLLGRKALVTVSEMSVLTITEDLHQATINLDSGFIGLSVARKRMDNGEFIEIRTPHAVAAVRGTKVMAEVPTPDITRLTVVEGHVDVYSLSAPNQVISVSTRQSVSATRIAPGRLENLSPKILKEKQQKLMPPKNPAANSTVSDVMVKKHRKDATQIAKKFTQPKIPNQPLAAVEMSGDPDLEPQSNSGDSGSSSGSGSTGGGTPSGGSVSTASGPSSPAPSPSPAAQTAPAPAPMVSASPPVSAPVAIAPAAPSKPAPVVVAPAPQHRERSRRSWRRR